jgi:hypothetical protein
MYSLQEVSAACGPNLAKYVQNKARGGAAGQKGTRYEDRFALLKIGEAAQAAFARIGSFSASWNVSFRSQAFCFVDDLVVYRSATRTAHHYQAKNQATVAWGQGAKSLSSDFRNQLKLGRSRMIQTTVTLVVNSRGKAKKLLANIPSGLKKYTFVSFFPPDQSVYKLLEYKPMRDGLNALLGPDPTDDRLVTVGMLLQSAWTEAGKVTTLKKMVEELHKREAPLLRPLNPVRLIDSRLKATLDSIPHFSYSLEKGFMRWRYGTTDRGCFSEHCGTQKFASFAQRVISRRPGTFADLEVELG